MVGCTAALTITPTNHGESGGSVTARRIVFGLSLALVVAAITWTALAFLQPKVRAGLAGPRLTRPLNILVLGTDKQDADGHSRVDVIMLVVCDPQRQSPFILSIPRDTLVEIPGRGVDRINETYSVGGSSLAVQAVEDLTDLTVDHYLVVDFQFFTAFVNLLGGVEIEVDKRMYYQDKSQDLLIDLQPGLQTLNGEQALGYVRYRRDPMADIARVGRQQKLIAAIMRQLQQENLWTKVIPIFNLKRRYIRTDLSLFDLYRLQDYAIALTSGDGPTAFTVPGSFAGPYWAADRRALAALIAEEFAKPAEADEKRRPDLAH